MTKLKFYVQILFLGVFLFTFYLPKNLMAVGEASTKFFVYVPPNNSIWAFRDVCLIVTAITDDTQVTLTDDDRDGDSDDSWSGVLNKGQSYVCYIRDGLIDDDSRGKADGDYFLISADHPVLVSQSTNSDWQHDWVPSDNKKMLGNTFYIYAPPTTYSRRDINIFAYEDNTNVTIKDISVVGRQTTGTTLIDIEAGEQVAQFNLNVGDDIIYKYGYGRNLLYPGRTYMIQSTKPITVQYGALWGNERDGGGFVPGSNGYSSGSLFYFTVPFQLEHEQEIRIVSFNDDNHVYLDYFDNGSWINLDSWTLNSYEKAEWLSKNSIDVRSVFRVRCDADKKVSVFEANWLETGASGTSDVASFISSEDGTTAGKKFICYMAPPGYENNNRDPLTGDFYGGKFTHLMFFANMDGTEINVKDLNTLGRVINRHYLLNKEEYVDCRLSESEYNSIYNGDGNPDSGPERPYLVVESNNPISVFDNNWNDNWMTYVGSVLIPVIESSTESRDEVVSTQSFTITNAVKNTGTEALENAKIEVLLPDGMNYVNSNLINLITYDSLGPGVHSINTNHTEKVVWDNLTINVNDSLRVVVDAQLDSVYANGDPIGDGQLFTVTCNTSGTSGGEYIETQSSNAIYASTSSGGVVNDTSVVAFEDLKNLSWNDWDYNDFVARIISKLYLTKDGNVYKIVLRYEPLARGATMDHSFYQKIQFNGSAIGQLSVYDSTGQLINTKINLSFTDDSDYPIFESTKAALPPVGSFNTTNTMETQTEVVHGWTAIFTLELNNPSLNSYSEFQRPPFDPYLITERGAQIHISSLTGTPIGNTQNLDNVSRDVALYGYPLDLGILVNKNWKWPKERIDHAIWKAYPNFVSYIKSGKKSNTDWFLSYASEHIWHSGASINVNQTSEYSAETPHQKLQKALKLAAEFPVKFSEKIYSSPLLYNIDGTPGDEIIAAGMDGVLHVIDASGKDIDGWPVSLGATLRSSPALGNLDDEPDFEIVVATEDGKVHALKKDGTELPGFPIATERPIKASPVITDIDNDNANEIIVNGGDSKIYIWDQNGKLKSGWPVEIQGNEDVFGQILLTSSTGVADLNGDGFKEIFCATTAQKFYLFDHSGTPYSNYPVELDDWVYASPAVGQFDNDPTFEIVIISGKGTIYVFNEDGTTVDGFPLSLNEKVSSSPVVYDLDHDGYSEIIVGTLEGRMYVIDRLGKIWDNWPQETFSSILCSPILADIDGDGQPEIITGNNSGRIFAWHLNGNSDPEFDRWFGSTNGWIFATPAVGDVDDDGKIDLVVGSFDKELYLFDLPSTFSQENAPWPMFRGNVSRTGLVAQSSLNLPQATNFRLLSFFNYPNPVEDTDETTFQIDYSLPPEKIRLRIFDVGGALVREFNEADFAPVSLTRSRCSWDLMNGSGKKVSNGVYICRVEISRDGKTFRKIHKLALIR